MKLAAVLTAVVLVVIAIIVCWRWFMDWVVELIRNMFGL